MRDLLEVHQIVIACNGSTLGTTSSRFLFYLLAASPATSRLKSELRWSIWNIRVVKAPVACGRNYSSEQKIVIIIITVLQTKCGYWKVERQCIWPLCDRFVSCPSLSFTHMKSCLCPYVASFFLPLFPWALYASPSPSDGFSTEPLLFPLMRHPRTGTWSHVLDRCLSLEITAPARSWAAAKFPFLITPHVSLDLVISFSDYGVFLLPPWIVSYLP